MDIVLPVAELELIDVPFEPLTDALEAQEYQV